MKSFLYKYKYEITIIALCLVVIFMLRGIYNSNLRLSDYKKQIQKFEIKEQSYNELIKENGSKIIEQEQIFLSEKDAINHNLLLVKKELKKVKNQIRYKSKIEIDSVFIEYNNYDTLYKSDTIFPFKEFNLNEQFYSINGVVKQNGVLIQNVSFNNDMTITIANKRNGIFKKSTPIVQLDNTNPYITSNSLQNITIKNEVKWYEKKSNILFFGLATGILTGIIITK